MQNAHTYLALLLSSCIWLMSCNSVIADDSTNSADLKAACDSVEYKQFDFWIGDWDVYDGEGKLVGQNKIFPLLKGCALSENWTSAKGNSGVSYSFYDKAEKKWHQTWIDQSGGALYLDGGLKEGKMILQGSRPGKNGQQTLQKITWSPLKDGRVKQHWQVSKNNGATWSDAFIGFYTRK